MAIKKMKEVTIGTDLEFLMINPKTGRVVKAGQHFGQKDLIGSDANGINFEVRSLPSLCPFKVVESIRQGFQEFVNNNPEFYNYRWIAPSFAKGVPAGFHFHIATKFDKKYLPYLDNYLGAISLLLEPKSEGILRRKYNKSPGGADVSYGKMGDIREKKYGGFEYRPVSSCASFPYALTAMLCLGKIIMYEAMNNPSFVPFQFIEPDDFVTVNQAKIRRFFPQLWKDITKLTLYPKYKKHIDLIKYFVDNKKIWQQGKGEMKMNWGIKDFSKFIKPAPAPQIKFNKFIVEEPIEAPVANWAFAPAPVQNLLDFDTIWNFEEKADQ